MEDVVEAVEIFVSRVVSEMIARGLTVDGHFGVPQPVLILNLPDLSRELARQLLVRLALFIEQHVRGSTFALRRPASTRLPKVGHGEIAQPVVEVRRSTREIPEDVAELFADVIGE